MASGGGGATISFKVVKVASSSRSLKKMEVASPPHPLKKVEVAFPFHFLEKVEVGPTSLSEECGNPYMRIPISSS